MSRPLRRWRREIAERQSEYRRMVEMCALENRVSFQDFRRAHADLPKAWRPGISARDLLAGQCRWLFHATLNLRNLLRRLEGDE